MTPTNALNTEEELLIKQWIPSMKGLSLLYMASKDGFHASDLYRLCDGKAHTIIIITSELSKRFGGYTHLAFDSTTGWVKDSLNIAFLFSLTNKQKFPIEATQNACAICSHASYGTWFGFGSDLLIYSNSNENTNIFSSFGYTYDSSAAELAFGTPEAQSYLAGSYHFSTKEILVFEVNL